MQRLFSGGVQNGARHPAASGRSVVPSNCLDSIRGIIHFEWSFATSTSIAIALVLDTERKLAKHYRTSRLAKLRMMEQAIDPLFLCCSSRMGTTQ